MEFSGMDPRLAQGGYAVLDFTQKEFLASAYADGNTHLHNICRTGDRSLLSLALTYATRDDLDIRNKAGWTALHVAVAEGQELVVADLLDKGCDPNAQSTSLIDKHPVCSLKGVTALHLAAGIGSDRIIKRLAEKSGDVNKAADRGFTPLHIASDKGHRLAVEALLNLGAKANAATVDDTKSIHLAAKGGFLDCLEALKAKGADLNATRNGVSALAYGAKFAPVVAYLLNQGVDPNQLDDNGEAPIHWMCKKGKDDLNDEDMYLKSLKVLVAHKGANKADINLKGTASFSGTPIYSAVDAGQRHHVRFLLDNGAEVDKKTFKKADFFDRRGKPALLYIPVAHIHTYGSEIFDMIEKKYKENPANRTLWERVTRKY